MSTARRVLLPLAVVFVVLATAGWIARGAEASPDAYEVELREWDRGTVAGRPLPDPDAPPDRISGFFAGLTRAQRDRLADRYPLVVGNLAGAPVTLRYRANRRALAEARDAERRRMTDPRLSPAGQHEAGRRMHRFESMLTPGRQFLSFDPTGRGRAAEVFGDLTTADRISVVVPGVDTELLTFERTQRKYTAPSGMAEALYQQERAVAPEESTAVIAWADYDSPVGLAMSAATAELAAHGADRLVESVRALPGDAPVALFCHSYGSVVCGVAASELPRRVSDIAVAGSPGMRASDVADLDTTARVWAMRAEDDWIQDVPHLAIGPLGHGTDPATPSFGARLLSTGDAEGHSGYFEPDARSLENLALIGAGSVNDVTCAPGVAGCAPADPCARRQDA
ncbi:alpha/beta hydrolase [Streptomyces litchfieldiae]|uniref:Alpha/beta hydrolase n=1 Tax=Streptomyces litchfieldiae TaxID=3075543 RepID=A0ABU2MXA2_9ACTN|nr:alpha/beta hydrolase [Streptomyces sp. DSM 44938]MDT0346282.1 alpha/beta hydrolase [Streptomyces sp. DSM 44938]